MEEVKRVLSKKKLILIILTSVLNAVLFAYINNDKSNEEYVANEVSAHASYIESYSDSVNAIIDNADNLKKYSIFTKAGSYSYANILQTASDFERVKNVNVTLDSYVGVQRFTNYYMQYFFTMAIMIFVIYDLFSYRDNGMWHVIFCAANGRVLYALKQILAIIASAVLIHSSMYWSVFIISMLINGGVGDLSNPIQTVDEFANFTYPLSKIQYVFVLYLVALICIICLCLIIWSFFGFFRNRNYPLIIILLFIGVEHFLHENIDIHSNLNALHYINIISLVKINNVLSTYRNWGFNTYVFPVFSVLIFIMVILTAILIYSAVTVIQIKKPESGVSFSKKILDYISGLYQRILFRFPFLFKEFHKLVFSNKCVWIIAIILIVTAYVCGIEKYYYTDNALYLDEQYREYGGADYSYFKEYMDDLYSQQEALRLEVEAYTADSISDNIESYLNLKNAQQTINAKIRIAQEFLDKIQYIDEFEERTEIKVWIISDRGYEVILGNLGMYRKIIMMIAVISGIMLIAFESGEIEYQSGMILLANSSAVGRRKIRSNKVVANIIFAICMSAAVYGIEFFWMWHTYGMPHLDAPLFSLTFMGEMYGKGLYGLEIVKSVMSHLTIGTFMIIAFLIKIVIGIAAAMAMLALSGFTKCKVKGIEFLCVAVVAVCICIMYVKVIF